MLKRGKPAIEIKGEIMRQTGKAICIKMHLPANSEIHETEQWIPISQIEEIHPKTENEEFDKLIITEWIAKTKEFI